MRRPVLCILALVTACAGTGHAEAPEAVPDPVVGPAAVAVATPSPVIPTGPVMTHYTNLQILVADPAASSNAVRGLLLDAGGEIVSLSASRETASLNATLPHEALAQLRHALARLPGSVESESSSNGDMTPTVTQLGERLAKLELAEAELDRIMRSASDRAVFDALLTQRELNTRERDSLHQQIASYLQQARNAQLNITFVARAAPPGLVHAQ
jgi:hypothetical protein